MIFLKKFTFNPFQENTYLLYNELNNAWIIDPGMFDVNELNSVIHFLEEHSLNLKGIINTHAHIDHILGVNMLLEKYPELTFSLHEKELPVLNSAKLSAERFGFPFGDIPKVTNFFTEKSLMLDNDSLILLFVPGHSPGSIAFYNPTANWVIAGDTLFNGSIGRTDLPFCNTDDLLNSIKTQLYTLPNETIVHPGHGPETSIHSEKLHNPFIKG